MRTEGPTVKTTYKTITFDIEHTGLKKDGGTEEMVHFAAVRADGKSLELFFLPKDCYFTDQAAKINGLTVEEL